VVSSHEHNPSRPGAFAAAGWLLVVAFASGAVDLLSLPGGPDALDQSVSGRELFHAQWLVLGTLIALAVVRLARASLLLGALGVVLSSAEMILVVHTAADRFGEHGLAMTAPVFWYGVAITQSLIFLLAGVIGGRRRLADRQWTELVHRITVDPAASVGSPRLRVIPRRQSGPDARTDN
jgi:hypothetical protein